MRHFGRSRKKPLSAWFSPAPTPQLRKAPRRRSLEQLEPRHLMTVVGTPTDEPYFEDQWHLFANLQQVEQPNSPTYNQSLAVPGEDLNVLPAWELGYTGAGVQIAVVDGGFDLTHEDLIDAYRTDLGFDFITIDDDPSFNDTTDAHATAVSGIIGARDNGVGMVGIAYGSDIVPIRFISGNFDQEFSTIESEALMFRYLNGVAQDADLDGVVDPIDPQDVIDVYNHSWGRPGALREAQPLPPGVDEAIRDSVERGRASWTDLDGDGIFDLDEVIALGSIHVTSAGNDAGAIFSEGFQDVGIYQSAQYDAFKNSRYTIAVGAVDYDGAYENPATGTTTAWAETGAPVLLVAPSGTFAIDIASDTFLDSGIWTADNSGPDGYNAGPVELLPGEFFETDDDFFPDENYTSTFGGTSASGPMVAATVGLMLEANPNLSYRDVQMILMMSARQNDQFNETWVVNPFKDFQGLNDQLFRVPDWQYYNLGFQAQPEVDEEGNVGDVPDPDESVRNAILPNWEDLDVLDVFFGNDAGLRMPFPNFQLTGEESAAEIEGIIEGLEQQFSNITDFGYFIESSTVTAGDDGIVNPGAGQEFYPDAAPPLTPLPPPELVEPAVEADLPLLVFAPGGDPLLDGQSLVDFLINPNPASGASASNIDDLLFENGAGFTVSWGYGRYLEEIGYAHGVLDAGLAVELAEKWETYDLYLTDEVTSTSDVLTTARIQPAGEVDLGGPIFVVPGGQSGVDIDTTFFEQFDVPFEFEDVTVDVGDGEVAVGSVITNGPFYNPDGELDLPPINRGTSSIPFVIDQGVETDFTSVEWIEVRAGSIQGNVDTLRISLKSPDGTRTELSPFRAPTRGAPSIYQQVQGQQGTPIPGQEIIDDDFVSSAFFGDQLTDMIDGSERFEVNLIDLPGQSLADGDAWTWTTNRHWGEIFSAEAHESDNPDAFVTGQWELIVENWDTDAFFFNGLEIVVHGAEATGTRIQGKIGIDDNKQQTPVLGSDNLAGDDLFNFDRHLEHGEVTVVGVDQEGNPVSVTLAVVVDDALDTVKHDEVHRSIDPDTGIEYRYAVVDREAYFTRDMASLTGAIIDAQPELSELSGVFIDTTDSSLIDDSGNVISYRNFDYSQESFAAGVVVQAKQYVTSYDTNGIAGPRAEGETFYFATGADGNYFFDVPASPPRPDVSSPDYLAWQLEYGAEFEYEISLVDVAASDISTSDFAASDTRDPITHDSGLRSYTVALSASPNIKSGQAVVVDDVNFLLKQDSSLTTASVDGQVYVDFNNDGVFNAADTGVAGVRLVATYTDTEGASQTVEALTDALGNYSLQKPNAAENEQLVVAVDPSSIPSEWELLSPANGQQVVNLTPGGTVTADFTLNVGGAGPGLAAVIAGSVFNDVNGDGIQQTGVGGELDFAGVRVYIDSNANLTFDAGESSSITNPNGDYTIALTSGGTYDIRVDFDSLGAFGFEQTTPTGGVGVEMDRAITVSVDSGGVSEGNVFGLRDRRTLDYGDLAGYPIASHTVIHAVRLGADVSTELEPRDTDTFDDGVTMTPTLIEQGATLEFDVQGVLQGGTLNAWIDFNNDGDWDDPGEQIFTNQGLDTQAGFNTITTDVTAEVDPNAEMLAARFRWGPFNLGPSGSAISGEVEDYWIYRDPNSINAVRFQDLTANADYNADGSVTQEDYDIWVASFGQTGQQLADGNGDLKVDIADYTIWADAYRSAQIMIPLNDPVVAPLALAVASQDSSQSTVASEIDTEETVAFAIAFARAADEVSQPVASASDSTDAAVTDEALLLLSSDVDESAQPVVDLADEDQASEEERKSRRSVAEERLTERRGLRQVARRAIRL